MPPYIHATHIAKTSVFGASLEPWKKHSNHKQGSLIKWLMWEDKQKINANPCGLRALLRCCCGAAGGSSRWPPQPCHGFYVSRPTTGFQAWGDLFWKKASWYFKMGSNWYDEGLVMLGHNSFLLAVAAMASSSVESDLKKIYVCSTYHFFIIRSFWIWSQRP